MNLRSEGRVLGERYPEQIFSADSRSDLCIFSEYDLNHGGTEKKETPPPKSFTEQYNIITRIVLFQYLFYVISLYRNLGKGLKNMNLSHIPLLNKKEQPGVYIDKFKGKLAELKSQGSLNSRRLLTTFLKFFGRDYIFSVLTIYLDIVARCTFSIFINYAVVESSKGRDIAWMWAGLIIVNMICHNLLGQRNMIQMINIATRIRLIIAYELFKKITSLDSYSVKKSNLGKVINIIANDMNTLDNKSIFFVSFPMAPFTLFLVIILLWVYYGPLSLIIVPVFGFYFLVQTMIGKFLVKFLKNRNLHGDQRIKFCSEVIEGIRLIKMYGWELAFKDLVDEFRVRELAAYTRIHFISFVERSFAQTAGFISTLILLSVAEALGISLYPGLIFGTLQILDISRLLCVFFLGRGISLLYEMNVAFTRISDVLNIQEKHFPVIKEEEFHKSTNVVEMRGYSGWWTDLAEHKSEQKNEEQSNSIRPLPVLKNITLTIEKGKFYGIFGIVGCGKSSLLQAILQEIPYFEGQFNLRAHSVAYVESEPFIFPGTLKENILFERAFSPRLYSKIINLCCLEEDIDSMPKGDETEIGERGINLSGGQKARVSLARALYSQADLYLLDDPLSAVDSRVGRQIFEKVLKIFLKGKTIILVTHQVQFLAKVDFIHQMAEGEVIKEGTYSAFKNDLETEKKEKAEVKNNGDGSPQKKANLIDGQKGPLNQKDISSKTDRLFTNEENEQLQNGLTVFWKYIVKSKSLLLTFIVIFCYVAAEICRLMVVRVLGFIGNPSSTLSSKGAISLASILVLVYFVFAVIKEKLILTVILRANRNIHYDMMESVLRSPVLFFDRNPSGLILNRLSTDLNQMDNTMVSVLVDFLDVGLNFLGMVVSVCTVNYYFTIVLVTMAFTYTYMYEKISLPVTLLNKLDLIYKSPLFTSFTTSINGLIPIRIYNRREAFFKKYEEIMNKNARTNFCFWGVSRGMSSIIEWAGIIFSTAGVFSLLSMKLDQGLAGQSLLFLCLSTSLFQYLLRLLIQLKTISNSISRVLRYTELPSEGELFLASDKHLYKKTADEQLPSRVSSNKKPHRNRNPAGINEGVWPAKGEITFKNVFMRYRDNLDYVLKGISFEVYPGEKVGCIGRTGAGKSSLVQALFRMVKIENIEGSGIFIDGQSIETVGLNTLRSGISIIPQTPFVFTGTIRRNMDPFSEHSEKDILKSLSEVELLYYVQSLPKGLDTDMTNANSIFSAGQKQLVCLARALLKKSRILVLDEATANVDFSTDELIQKKIKENFRSSSVFTIAHRLLTIADYDKVLVIDKGVVVEQGSPFALLANERDENILTGNGIFAEMVKQTGPENSQRIFQLAKKSFFAREHKTN